MSYRLRLDDPPADGVRAVAVERLASASQRLREDHADDPVSAVHGARKDLKKTRAALRLVRPCLSSGVYRHESTQLRDLGRSMSGIRNADVKLETIEAFADRFVGQLPKEQVTALERHIAAQTRDQIRAEHLAPRADVGGRACRGLATGGLQRPRALRGGQARVSPRPQGVRRRRAGSVGRTPARVAQARQGPVVPPAPATRHVAGPGQGRRRRMRPARRAAGRRSRPGDARRPAQRRPRRDHSARRGRRPDPRAHRHAARGAAGRGDHDRPPALMRRSPTRLHAASPAT